jgi:hypothetical protein
MNTAPSFTFNFSPFEIEPAVSDRYIIFTLYDITMGAWVLGPRTMPVTTTYTIDASAYTARAKVPPNPECMAPAPMLPACGAIVSAALAYSREVKTAPELSPGVLTTI